MLNKLDVISLLASFFVGSLNFFFIIYNIVLSAGTSITFSVSAA
jgi:hypothetical protein